MKLSMKCGMVSCVKPLPVRRLFPVVHVKHTIINKSHGTSQQFLAYSKRSEQYGEDLKSCSRRFYCRYTPKYFIKIRILRLMMKG